MIEAGIANIEPNITVTAAPVVLLLLLLRRTFYIWSHPQLAAAASGIYMVAMFAILYALYRSGTLSSFTAPLAAAGASALTIASICSGVAVMPPWFSSAA